MATTGGGRQNEVRDRSGQTQKSTRKALQSSLGIVEAKLGGCLGPGGRGTVGALVKECAWEASDPGGLPIC